MRDEQDAVETLNLRDLKATSPKDLVTMAEGLEIENASTMRKGELMFSILRERADEGWEISGEGVLEVVQDGFGFLRNPEANYLPGPDDIYLSPDVIRSHSLRTGDTVDGVIQAPDENERYFCLIKVTSINFEEPEKARHKVSFDNLTPLYPDERFEHGDRGSDDQGSLCADYRPGRAGGQGPAKPDRGAAADGQDGALAEHREVDRSQPSRMLSDGSSDRRAARRGDRHAAIGEGRGDFLYLRRACHPPCRGVRDGDREGQAPGRAQARRRDPAGFDHAPGPGLQYDGSVIREGADGRCPTRTRCNDPNGSSAPHGTSRREAR